MKKSILLIALAMGTFTGALAQEEKSTGGLDKKQGTKKGVTQSLAEADIDEEKIPGKLEVGIALGSCAAMIIVVKWL